MTAVTLFVLGRCGRPCPFWRTAGSAPPWRDRRSRERPRALRLRAPRRGPRRRGAAPCVDATAVSGGARAPPPLRRSARRRSCSGPGAPWPSPCGSPRRSLRVVRGGASCAWWLLLEVRPGHCQPRAAGERGLARQALVEKTAERVDIRAAVDRARPRSARGRGRQACRRSGPRRPGALLVESSGQSEVGEIDMLARIEQHVRGLDVPMDETFRVCGVEGIRDLAADGERARWRRAPLPRAGAPSDPFPRRGASRGRGDRRRRLRRGSAPRSGARATSRAPPRARSARGSADRAPARAPSASARPSVSAAGRRRGRRRPSHRGRSARRSDSRRTRSRSGSLSERSRHQPSSWFKPTPLPAAVRNRRCRR